MLFFFHSLNALVKHEMVLITLPVHIFLTLQLEGKLAQKIILLYVGWGLNWATSSGAENLYF